MTNILTIDVGSSSMRGCLFDPSGSILLSASRQYSMQSDDFVQVEMEADIFASSLHAILTGISRGAAERGYSVDAVALTSQRSSILPLDAKGNPLHPIIMWHDKRSAPICDELSTYHKDIYGICGMRPTPVFSAPKMAWLRRNRPEIYKAAHKLVGIHDYLLFLLTGKMVTDTSLASRTNLFNIQKLAWSDDLLRIFGLDKEKLCEALPVGGICGTASTTFAAECGLKNGIPVISAGGDQQCAALGLGVLEHGAVGINSGSGSYVIASSDRPCLDPQMRVLCNVSAVPGKWIVEGSVLSSGLVYKWFKDEFCPNLEAFADVNECCSFSPPGARGLIMIPSLSGKGAPYWDPQARGSFHNISLGTTHADFARSVLEGIVASLADCLEVVREVAGLDKFSSVTCAGGLTANELYNHIQCDTYQTPLRALSSAESTTRGAWISASVTLGLHAGYAEALALSISREQTRLYEPDPAAGVVYGRVREARRYIYETLSMRRVQALLSGEEPK